MNFNKAILPLVSVSLFCVSCATVESPVEKSFHNPLLGDAPMAVTTDL